MPLVLPRITPLLCSADAIYWYYMSCVADVDDAAADGVTVMPGNGLYAEGGALMFSLLGFCIHLLLPGRQGSRCCRSPAEVAPAPDVPVGTFDGVASDTIKSDA